MLIPKRIPLKNDRVGLQAFDDQRFGDLRIIVDQQKLRIEHQRPSGATTDAVTVNLKTRALMAAGIQL